MEKIAKFYEKINLIAPFRTAYQWDNVGLLVGDMNTEVEKVLITLDVTEKIVIYAIKNGVQLIISHHPLMMQGIKNITQKKLLWLLENKIALITAHTNLDVSRYGVNYTLAETLELQNIKPLSLLTEIKQYQISVYVPDHLAPEIMHAMHEAGAGIIGNYTHCATFYDTKGQFFAQKSSNPYLGQKGIIEKVKETKIEMLCEDVFLPQIIRAILKIHPYEEPLYTIIPLQQKSPNFGMGCYGELSNNLSLNHLAAMVRAKLNAPFVKLWVAQQTKDDQVKKIAVCGGSGNSLLTEAKNKAEVYISADFTYHQFLDAPLPIIDAGHFWTENVICRKLAVLFSDFNCELMILPPQEHDIMNLSVL